MPLIRHIASALQNWCRGGGHAGKKWAGMNFAIAVSGEQDRPAAAFALAALELLAASAARNKCLKIYIGASISISGNSAECSSTELFRRADIAMYHAKKSGKADDWYDDALDAATSSLMIENGIRQGLE